MARGSDKHALVAEKAVVARVLRVTPEANMSKLVNLLLLEYAERREKSNLVPLKSRDDHPLETA